MHKFAHVRLIKFVVLSGLISFSSVSCSLLKKSKAEKVEAEQEQADSQAFSEIRKAQKAHYKMQPRETRKMMKRSMKMAKKANRVRRSQ